MNQTKDETLTTMISEVYEALISAGADEEKAKAAAKAIAENDARSGSIERKLIEHDGRFTLLQGMIGFNLAFTMAILWKVFS